MGVQKYNMLNTRGDCAFGSPPQNLFVITPTILLNAATNKLFGFKYIKIMYRIIPNLSIRGENQNKIDLLLRLKSKFSYCIFMKKPFKIKYLNQIQ